MHFNLAQLLMEPIGSTRDYDVDESFAGPEDGRDRAQGWVRLIRTHQGVIVRARLETQVNLTCSRCVRVFQYKSLITVEEESFPTIDPATGRKTESIEENESDIRWDDQKVRDMSEVVRQYVLTGVPINRCVARSARDCARNVGQT